MTTAAAQALSNQLQQMEKGNSLFQQELSQLPLTACQAFSADKFCQFSPSDTQLEAAHADQTKAAFPKTISKSDNRVLTASPAKRDVTGKNVAVLFSGGPAAGGHNVLVGIKEALGEQNTLYGVKAGPAGLIAGDLFEITTDNANTIRNSGGFDFLGSDRTKIKTDAQYEAVKATVKKYNLDGIVIVGGDDSNTNAAFLAEYLYDEGCSVVGVPKTIDGDLQVGDLLPISFGFDTATRVYSEVIGNILQDAPSSRKYWHFVKLMGRSASHVALEVALQTHPHITLISENVNAKQMTLQQLVQKIAAVVAYRASRGMNYGVVMVPEGLIEFVPELRTLIDEINAAMATVGEKIEDMLFPQRLKAVQEHMSAAAVSLFNTLPDAIQQQLLLDRDSHGNLKVSQIPTEELLMEMTTKKIRDMQQHPDAYFLKEDLGEEANSFFGEALVDMTPEQFKTFTEFKYQSNPHFFGYEGRCGAPSRFDANYTYNLGLVAGSLVSQGYTGYMAAITDLHQGARALAIPLTGLITTEIREGKETKVIEKALVKLDSPAFAYFEARRWEWAKEDLFSSPGPLQFWGPSTDQMPMTVALNRGYESLAYKF